MSSGLVSANRLEEALRSCPAGVRLGEYLVQSGDVNEEALYQALSVQQSLPLERLEPSEVDENVSRALPRRVMREWQVLPFRAAGGTLLVASPEIPTDEMQATLRGFTRLTLRFRLITPGNFRRLEHAVRALH
ncbi:MAG: hypothetical protein JO022_04955 [Acidobacteriaceae bacterium]|nr:hypothetical protein [Acidobacteriaceae bacterium]